jgi:cyclopropane-fatty-acyl-phospholipid synthase
MQQHPHERSRGPRPFPALAALQHRVADLLGLADVRIDGERPWDMQVHDPRLFGRLLAQGSLALGDGYMDGDWDTGDLDGLLFRLLESRLDEQVRGIAATLDALRAQLLNLQAPTRSDEVARRHYDLGNDLYRAMLGPRMIYSCGYWHGADGRLAGSLDAAQDAKLDLVCRKLGLARGMRVLDIGCGWGGALAYAAEHYGICGVGVTISREQADWARDYCRGLPLEIRLQDYRELDEPFDRVFSIGMFEHVGVDNYPRFFDVVRRCLADDGLFLLHTIGGNRSARATDPWIARHIFPNSMLPSAAQLAGALDGRFVIEDWHNFGADYDLTLQAWRRNVEIAWPRLDAAYDERFRRMWRFYLASAMALFRSRRGQLWQLVLSPRGVPGGYIAPR